MFRMFLDNLKPSTFTCFKFKVPNFKLELGTGNIEHERDNEICSFQDCIQNRTIFILDDKFDIFLSISENTRQLLVLARELFE